MPSISMRLLHISLVCCFAAICLASSAWATPILSDRVYTYQGPDFTVFGGNYGCSSGIGECAITASVTITGILGPNFNGDVDPVAFTISDGVTTLTSSESGIQPLEFYFVTDSTGTIVDWLVDVNYFPGDGITNLELFTSVNRFGSIGGNCSVPANDGTSGVSASGLDGCAQTVAGPGGGFSLQALTTNTGPVSNTGPIGVWTLQPPAVTPEPPSLYLLVFGITGLALLNSSKTLRAQKHNIN